MGNCMGPTRGGGRRMGTGEHEPTSVYYERYKQERKQLGEGRAGHVFRTSEKGTGKIFACKNIAKSNQSIIECRREVAILNKLRGSKHIIFMKEVYEDSKYLFLVTELCSGGELYDQIVTRSETPEGAFSEVETALMMRQIIGAVAGCHRANVTHRDLKPENLMLVNKDDLSQLRLIDFGLSRFFKPDTRCTTRVGTVYYTAPEVWSENYDQSCDLWSAGVIMYVLLCSYPPFDGNTDKDILRTVCKGRYSFPSPEWDNISPEAKNLIRKCLNKNPKRRPTAEEALTDPWFQEYGVESEEEGSEGGESDEELDLDTHYKGVALSPNDKYMVSAEETASSAAMLAMMAGDDDGDDEPSSETALKGVSKGGRRSPPEPGAGDGDSPQRASPSKDFPKPPLPPDGAGVRGRQGSGGGPGSVGGGYEYGPASGGGPVRGPGKHRREVSEPVLTRKPAGEAGWPGPADKPAPVAEAVAGDDDDDGWGVASVGKAMGLY